MLSSDWIFVSEKYLREPLWSFEPTKLSFTDDEVYNRVPSVPFEGDELLP